MNFLDFPQVFIVFGILYWIVLFAKVQKARESFEIVSELIEIKKIEIYKNEKDARILRE